MTTLSQSSIWSDQIAAFDSEGIANWTHNGVPYQITSSPLIAHLYLELILSHTHSDSPIHIFEIAAGTGKFAHAFLTAYSNHPMARNRPLHYTISDISSSLLTYWFSHPLLKPYIQNKTLTTTLFNPICDTLPATPSPLILIANYAFDALPLEIYRKETNTLFIAHTPPNSRASQINSTLAFLPVQGNDHPFHYLNSCPNAYIPYPKATIQFLQRCQNACPNGLLALVGDKGYCTPDHFPSSPPKAEIFDGPFFYPVNFDAIANTINPQSGSSLLPSTPNTNFNVALFALNSTIKPVTKKLYHTMMDSLSPQHCFEVLIEERGTTPPPDFEEKLFQSCYDPAYFFQFDHQTCSSKTIEQVAANLFPHSSHESALYYTLAEHLSNNDPLRSTLLHKMEACAALPPSPISDYSHVPLRGKTLLLGINESSFKSTNCAKITSSDEIPRSELYDTIVLANASSSQKRSDLVKEGDQLVESAKTLFPNLTNMRYTTVDLESFLATATEMPLLTSSMLFAFIDELLINHNITPVQSVEAYAFLSRKGLTPPTTEIKKYTVESILPILRDGGTLFTNSKVKAELLPPTTTCHSFGNLICIKKIKAVD